MDAQLLGSFERVLTAISEKIAPVSPQLISQLQTARAAVITTPARIRPWVYGLHWSIVEAIRQRNSDALLRLVGARHRLGWTQERTEINRFPTSDDRLISRRNMHDVLVAEHKSTYSLPVRFAPVRNDSFAASKAKLFDVLKYLGRHDPDGLDEIYSLISEISFINTESLNAGSSFPIYGCLYLNILRESEPWTAYLEHVVHETAHHLLFAIWAFDPILKSTPAQTFLSPLRKEPRPLSAIFHQMFVLSRVLRVWDLFQRSAAFGPEIYTAYTNYQNDRDGQNFTEKFWIAAEIIQKNAALTTVGNAIFASSCDMVRRSRVVFRVN